MKPKKFIRIDDGEEITLNDDGETYSFESMKKQFPNNLHMEYTLWQLSNRRMFRPREI